MSIVDNISDKAKDIVNEPDKKQKVEQLAKDKGLDVNKAKEHLSKKKHDS